MERDTKLRAAFFERRLLRWTGAGNERALRAETRCGRRRVERSAAEPPVWLALELVACDVTDREEVDAHISAIDLARR